MSGEHDIKKQTAEQEVLPLLMCPRTSAPLHLTEQADARQLHTDEEHNTTCSYTISQKGIPLFAQEFITEDAKAQQEHYDQLAELYITNLGYPHTQVYMAYLDDMLNQLVFNSPEHDDLGKCAELCCGTGEAVKLFGQNMALGIAIDISESMLTQGRDALHDNNIFFMQGDATQTPLKSQCVDNVFMLGGIHHVPDRQKLFSEVYRILKPGGRFIFREPVSDFWIWRILRAIIYRLSPALDHQTERPLTYGETVPILKEKGFQNISWHTYGFLGFCLFMNSDVLWFNRGFRFIPGIKRLTKLAARFDNWCTSLSILKNAGLQVISCAEKPL